MTSRAVAAAGLKASAPQEVHPEVEPAALVHQVVDFLVGLGVAELRVDLDRDEVRDRQPDGPRQLPASHSGHERPGPCPAPRNLTRNRPSSSASTRPGNDPPSRSGVT